MNIFTVLLIERTFIGWRILNLNLNCNIFSPVCPLLLTFFDQIFFFSTTHNFKRFFLVKGALAVTLWAGNIPLIVPRPRRHKPKPYTRWRRYQATSFQYCFERWRCNLIKLSLFEGFILCTTYTSFDSQCARTGAY